MKGMALAAAGILPVQTVCLSIWPLYLIVKELINRNMLNIKTVVPQWKDPHDYIFTPKDRMIIDASTICLEIGLGLEKEIKYKNIIELGNDYQKLIGKHKIDNMTLANPHIWLDPIIVRDYLVTRIVDILAKRHSLFVDMKKVKIFRQNLTEIDKKLRQVLKDIEHIPFMTEERAFDYFAREYNLMLSAHIENNGSKTKIGFRQLYNLSKIIREKNIRVLFIHATSSLEPYRIFSEDYGLKIYRLNPLGYGLASYKSMIYNNASIILKALEN